MRRPVGVKLVLRGFCWSLVLPSRAATVATLPSALSVSDLRSVQVRCSRFSRCCHLLSDLASIFRWRFGPGVCRSHRNSALGFVVSFLFNLPTLLPTASLDCCCVAARRSRRSPTVDAAGWPTSAPPPLPLVSSHSCLRARPASDPSAADHCRLQKAPERAALCPIIVLR